MDNRFSGVIATAVVAAVASAAISVSVIRTSAQAPVISGAGMKTPPLKTAWGEPDLQGIWTDEFETPLQRPAKYANQESFTEAQRAELDRVRSGILNRRATDRDAITVIMAQCSFPRSAPGHARRRLPIRPMAGSPL